ncbi:lysophospholipase [Saccharopolyspora taberi]|uniref:Alpha/beta hydrolase n=1 Tax=Saccharopolyspora taberi TaxID=60895 RepID=A0ABN3V8I0_9PSEU
MIEPTEREVTVPSGTLAVRTWSAGNPRWIALLSHGYGEHSGRYQWVAEQLVGAQALVCAPDHVGHGKSPGERVLFSDADTVVEDLEAVRRTISAEHPDLPVVLIGHSLGGMFAVRHAQKHQDSLSAVVLSAPVLGTWHVLDLLEAEEIPDTPIDPSTLSRDPQVGRDYVDDPLVWHGAFKRPTLAAIDRCLTAINEGVTLRVPTLWVHGEDDELVPEADTRTGIDRVRGFEFHEHVYPGGRHELFNETNRAEVLGDVLTFVGRELNT